MGARVGESLVLRLINGLINGFVIWLLLPSALSARLHWGWALALTLLWIPVGLVFLPLVIGYCMIQVLVHGPDWQYRQGKAAPEAPPAGPERR